MTVETGPSLDSLRIQLEGRLAILERSLEAIQRTARALRRTRWKAALGRERSALKTVLALGPEVAPVLAELTGRRKREGWSAQSASARFVRQVEAAQTALAEAVRARAEPGRSDDVYGQLEEWERGLLAVGGPVPDLTLVLQRAPMFPIFFSVFSIALVAIVLGGVMGAGGHHHLREMLVAILLSLVVAAPGILILASTRPSVGRVFRREGRLEIVRRWAFPRRPKRSVPVTVGSQFRIVLQQSTDPEIPDVYRLELRLPEGGSVVLSGQASEEEALEIAHQLAGAFGASLRSEKRRGVQLLELTQPTAEPLAVDTGPDQPHSTPDLPTRTR